MLARSLTILICPHTTRLKGTNFQINVWKTLLEIPEGWGANRKKALIGWEAARRA